MAAWVAVAAVLILAGCDPTACVRNSQCASGYTCRAALCVPRYDAGTDDPGGDPGGGGTDAGTTPAGDAGTDAGGFVLP